MKAIKSIICVSILACMSIMPVFAVTESIEDDFSSASSMCPVEKKVNGPIAATLSKITGMNAIIAATLESQVRKQMNKALNGDFKVEITPFGAKSMLEGKFKKISAKSDSIYLDGFYLSNVIAESLCGYNHFIYKNGEVYTNEDFLLGFSADVTTEDLQKTLSTPQYQKLLNSMTVNMGNVTIFKVYDPKAEIKNDRLFVKVKFISPLTLGEPRQVSTDMGLAVHEGKILFTDVHTSSSHANANINAFLPIINKLNPFIYKSDILNNPKSTIKIKDVDFVNNKIVIKGLVIVPKNYYNN